MKGVKLKKIFFIDCFKKINSIQNDINLREKKNQRD